MVNLFMTVSGDAKTSPLIESFMNEFKKEYESIGVVGYCWGGRYAVLLGKTESVKCVATAHPSFVSVQDVTANNNALAYECIRFVRLKN